jgi:uncharacterized membrane protein YkvA (DUF1232 family)
MGAAGFGQRIAEGALFRALKKQAAAYLRDPQKLSRLVRKASDKATSMGHKKPLDEVWSSLLAFFRLIRAVVRREYTGMPWQRQVLIVAGLLYFLTPIDLIPDFILGLGYLDDVAVIAWVIKAVQADLDAFLMWESARARAQPKSTNPNGQRA